MVYDGSAFSSLQSDYGGAREGSGTLGDPGAVSRVDKIFVAEHFIDPTNCPWVSEDEGVVD